MRWRPTRRWSPRPSGLYPEVLEGGQDGLLVAYADPRALADALRSILEDRDSALRRVARADVRVRSLDWSESVHRLRALYREVGAGSRRPSIKAEHLVAHVIKVRPRLTGRQLGDGSQHPAQQTGDHAPFSASSPA